VGSEKTKRRISEGTFVKGKIIMGVGDVVLTTGVGVF
jgi:hypothetical protein